MDERDPTADYMLSLYNRRGLRIGTRAGGMKLVIDPFMVYRNYPNQRTASYVVDARGHRDGHVNEMADRLVFVMGASVTFGQGLHHSGQTFASLLSARRRDYRVVNAGVIGIQSGQELAQMVHYLDDESPALYILLSGWNDLYDPNAITREWPMRSGPMGFNNTFIEMEDRLAAYLASESNGQQPMPDAVSPMEQARGKDEYMAEVMDNFVANVGKMSTFAAARGAGFLLVLPPEIASKQTRTAAEQAWLEQFDVDCGYLQKGVPDQYRQLRARMQTFCAARRIPCVDVNAASAFAHSPETLFCDCAHPNARGHEVIAHIIDEALAAHGM